ncbi:hypothetical protein [Streptosporangium sp. NPDC051022]|uniref:hypothetical protein n=1 Tax=Streptosporangium sp. NPDC051022 TaxID=3155752 RepID=UPI00343D7090
MDAPVPAARKVGTAGRAAGARRAVSAHPLSTIDSAAVAAQAEADCEPRARPGALVVEGFSADRADTVRVAVQWEPPGAPVVQNDRPPA